jgi:hypothetical protein
MPVFHEEIGISVEILLVILICEGVRETNLEVLLTCDESMSWFPWSRTDDQLLIKAFHVSDITSRSWGRLYVLLLRNTDVAKGDMP